jgi:peptidyl-prolyl cis-trans isomerase SurA
MKFPIWRAFVVVFFCLVSWAGNLSASATTGTGAWESKFWDEHYLNGIVAVVDDRVVTAGELRQEVIPLIARIEADSKSEEECNNRIRQAIYDILDDIIARILIIQDFQKSGMRLPKAQKEFQLDEFIRTRFGGDRLLFLQQLRTHGKSLQQFKREMEESLIVGWTLHRFQRSQSYISPRQIREYYESHRTDFTIPSAVRMGQLYLPAKIKVEKRILGDADASNPEEPRQEIVTDEWVENPEIQEVALRLQNGEPFEVVAQDFDSAIIPGEDGWVAVSDLIEELQPFVEQLDAGEYTNPVTLNDGTVAFLFLYARREEAMQRINQVQITIENILLQERMEIEQRRWINALRAKAYVRIYL